jgi:hypothetical protein
MEEDAVLPKTSDPIKVALEAYGKAVSDAMKVRGKVAEAMLLVSGVELGEAIMRKEAGHVSA